MASLSEVAGRLGVSLNYASGMVRRGIIEKKPRGQYDLDEAQTAYMAHLRKGAAGRDSDSGLSRERARLAREQADGQAIKNKLELGNVVERAVVLREVSDRFAIVRERLLGIPGKMVDCLSREQLDRLEKEITEGLNELSARSGVILDCVGSDISGSAALASN